VIRGRGEGGRGGVGTQDCHRGVDVGRQAAEFSSVGRIKGVVVVQLRQPAAAFGVMGLSGGCCMWTC
jgi:hypothetical protein